MVGRAMLAHKGCSQCVACGDLSRWTARDHATVGAHASIKGSYVGEGAFIGEGARIFGSVIGKGAAITMLMVAPYLCELYQRRTTSSL